MRAIAAFSIFLFVAVAGLAQNARSFVSVFGNDLNNCSTPILSECRTFNRALSATNPGGEVIATTTGGYAPFSVSKAITVTAIPGVHVSISSTGGGIDVSAGGSDRVILRGLHISLTGSGSGISAIAYGTLIIEGCEVTGGANGISITGSSSPAILSDTVVHNFSSSGFVISGHATLLHCRAERGQFSTGLLVVPGSVDGVVSAIDFVASGNQIGAAAVCTNAGHAVELSLDHAVLTDNTQDGLESVAISGSATARISNSIVTNNGAYGLNQAGTATLASMNNNFVAGNRTADTTGTISPIPVH
jgi:hypothetical protein